MQVHFPKKRKNFFQHARLRPAVDRWGASIPGFNPGHRPSRGIARSDRIPTPKKETPRAPAGSDAYRRTRGGKETIPAETRGPGNPRDRTRPDRQKETRTVCLERTQNQANQSAPCLFKEIFYEEDDFDKTDIKKFMDEYFAKDLFGVSADEI